MFCEDADDLNYWERVFVDETWVLRSDTYNLKTGGEQCYFFSPEARRKMSKAKKGMYDGEKHPLYGTHCSEETKQKLSQSLTGRKMPDGVGERHSKWMKEHNPFKGKQHSEETK